MRILQMSAYADPIGGAEIYMHGLADELERRGHEVGRFGTSPEREADEERIRIVRRPSFDPTRLVRDDEVLEALGGFVDRLAPDIIHVHNLYSLPLDVDRFLAGGGRPVVQTVHDLSTVCPNGWCVHHDGTLCPGRAGAQCFRHDCDKNYPYDAKLVLLTRLRHRILSSFMEVMICPSRYYTELVRRQGFRDVRHLFYFVDSANLELPAARREDRSLLFLGRLGPEKGVCHLIDAMPRILVEEPETRLKVVGDGPEAEALRAQTERLGLGSAVVFRGTVPYEQVKSFYATATLLILPSIWCENSPLTIYESMVAGLPVVGSRIGGIPDLVEDAVTGHLVEPRNPRELADKVIRLLRAPEERARMAERMQERSRHLTAGRNVDEVESIYREVLARERPAAKKPLSFPLDDEFVTILQNLIGDLQSRESYAQELLERVCLLEDRSPKGWIRRVADDITRRASRR
jgi:glycosyltransferase involved in cell wall biosynthesis